MRRHQGVIAVVIKQYGTGLYRTCVSLNRENSVCLGTHDNERSANERISQFWKAYDEGTIRHPDDLLCLVEAPEPLPATKPQQESPGLNQLP